MAVATSLCGIDKRASGSKNSLQVARRDDINWCIIVELRVHANEACPQRMDVINTEEYASDLVGADN